jgi:hypothetical protein
MEGEKDLTQADREAGKDPVCLDPLRPDASAAGAPVQIVHVGR